jgi:hypothetical protein
MRKRLAGARDAGASEEEVLETLYLAMRASAAHVRQQAFIAMEEVLGGVPKPQSRGAPECDC